VEGGHALGVGRRCGLCGAEAAGPDTRAHAREDVVKLDPGSALVPTTAASARTVAAFVQRHALASVAGPEAQPERVRPIRQSRSRDLARWAARLALGVSPRHHEDLARAGRGGRSRYVALRGS
jgi:hypothetical protein